ncbi:MAG TPA: hypothetical protein VK846_16245 [Candidatus Limnocylindria bacterium]|nr:hypothetical protein [Candidatus Limnocylindria bacterium]
MTGYYETGPVLSREVKKDAKPKPKATTESILAAICAVRSLRENTSDAAVCLYAARELFMADASAASVAQLNLARAQLVRLRRTQTAALENIDAAIASANGGAR